LYSFGKLEKPKKANDDSSDDEPMNEQAYLERNLSCEECDSDDLEGDINMSDDEDNAKLRVHSRETK